jgi:hypothetical protein
MRLWSLHPQYLDPQGLRGSTKGYRQHPQLRRFRSCASPRAAVNRYLSVVYAQARLRGYQFDRSKLGRDRPVPLITVTDGQLQHEWTWLLKKLRSRSPALYRHHLDVSVPMVHPLFHVVPGPVAEWERTVAMLPTINMTRLP